MRGIVYFIILLLSVALFYSCASDKEIQNNVEVALQATTPEVTATVNKRIVTLTGRVTTEQMKTSVENTIRNIKDVKHVNNHLIVEAHPVSGRDKIMKLVVETSLMMNEFHYIDVAVVGGVITLSGNIHEKNVDRLLNVVRRVNPSEISNQLTINQ